MEKKQPNKKSVKSTRTINADIAINTIIDCVISPNTLTKEQKEPLIQAILYKLNLIEWKDE